MDCLKLPQSPAEKDVTAGEPAEVESSASEAELIKEINVSRKHTRQHRKDTTVKWAQTSSVLVSGSIPSPTQGGDVPSNSDADVPGANKDEEEFQHNDVQVAKLIQDSQKACHSWDIETVFTDIIDEDGKKFQICQVCK